ncbi:rod shape-determining protein RodA [Psychroflexus planctonicus]|uniref:Rod shape-determining protein RodA n=2 Tax=Psychroflexus planctonicus TaxID=1526575 RepID=A0ABQ1SC58_9FLAO|nr:rod shape-determining protein RodA [Psychroflexus planctonicus]
MGWATIYSTTLAEVNANIFDISKLYGKQLLWIGLGVFLVVLVLSVEAKFYQGFASIIYIVALLALLGLPFFGKTIAGQTAWYSFGSFSIQPAEFVKVAAALAIAKYLTGINVSLKNFKNQFQVLLLMLLPMALIMLQPDAGSALIYLAFIFPLYREGLPSFYLIVGTLAVTIFLTSIKFGAVYVSGIILAILFLLLYIKRKQKPNYFLFIAIAALCIGFSFSANLMFDKLLQPHHKDRFEIILGMKSDPSGAEYNTYHSKVAIGSGGFSGKGWLQGTQTTGRYVPEQHTDYIFSAVGEEWGFLGSSIVILLFCSLMLRLWFLAERQKSNFSRIYGYSVVGILFFHFFVNIGMVLGVFPTVGIPLPFFSYGGSGLWGMLILIFIFLKFDAKRMD